MSRLIHAAIQTAMPRCSTWSAFSILALVPFLCRTTKQPPTKCIAFVRFGRSASAFCFGGSCEVPATSGGPATKYDAYLKCDIYMPYKFPDEANSGNDIIYKSCQNSNPNGKVSVGSPSDQYLKWATALQPVDPEIFMGKPAPDSNLSILHS